MLARHSLQKALCRIQPALLSRTMATNSCRLLPLARANSAVIGQTINVIDNLIHENGIEGANIIFRTECPVVETTLGKQLRHTFDHLEKVALDGIRAVSDKPIDLHYDVRERGGFHEVDIAQARQRALFIQNYFDDLIRQAEKEGDEACTADSGKHLTVYHTLPTGSGDLADEIPLASTLEREMAFVCHHAIHHCALIKAIAATAKTGLTPEHLPPDFGKAPTPFVAIVKEDRAA